VAKAETSPRKREQPPGGNTLHLKSRLDRAPNGLKTTSHSTAGEISGLAALALAERAHCPKGGDDIIGSLSAKPSWQHCGAKFAFPDESGLTSRA
jgi:hypothetical protein